MNSSKQMILNIIQATVCICLALFVIYVTLTQFTIDEYSMGGTFASHSFYPQLIAGILIFLSILLILTSLVKKQGIEDSVSGTKDTLARVKKTQSPEAEPTSKLRFYGIALLLILYTFFLDLFGYIVVTPFFMAALFILLRIRKWYTIILLSLGSTYLVYFLFSMLLDVLFPIGRYPLFGS